MESCCRLLEPDCSGLALCATRRLSACLDAQGMLSRIMNTSDDIGEDIYENFYHTALLKLALRRQKTKTAYTKCACLKLDMRHDPGSPV